MRRKSWFRAVATVLAVWFPLIVGEPGVVHACPAHGGAAATTAMAMAHHHGMPHGSQPGHDHHDCTCISCCVGSVIAAPTIIAPTTLFVDAIREVGATYPGASIARQAPEYSRPYTTGPPRV